MVNTRICFDNFWSYFDMTCWGSSPKSGLWWNMRENSLTNFVVCRKIKERTMLSYNWRNHDRQAAGLWTLVKMLHQISPSNTTTMVPTVPNFYHKALLGDLCTYTMYMLIILYNILQSWPCIALKMRKSWHGNAFIQGCEWRTVLLYILSSF